MTREIEVCTNAEWLGMDSESADCWFDSVVRQIEAALPGVECIGAKGQRMMFHGWNGANTFARKSDGLGTFDQFTDEEWATACKIAQTPWD